MSKADNELKKVQMTFLFFVLKNSHNFSTVIYKSGLQLGFNYTKTSLSLLWIQT